MSQQILVMLQSKNTVDTDMTLMETKDSALNNDKFPNKKIIF